MARLDIKIGASADGVKKGVRQARSSIRGLGRTLQTALGFSLSQIAMKLAELFKQGISFAVRMVAKFEDLNVMFRTLIGSQALAARTMAELKEFSIRTPFTPEEVFKASKALIAFGFTAKEQIKLMRQLGDVSAISGKNIEELAFIYGKVFSRGKAQMRELNQMIWAGIPIIDELAKVTGKSGNEIFEMSRRGEITFAMIEQAFKNMTGEGGRFFNGAEKRAQTLSGRWSTLKGVAMELGESIGKIFTPEVMQLMNWAIVKFEQLSNVIKQINVDLRGTDVEFSTLEKAMLLLSSTGIKGYKDMLEAQERFKRDLEKAEKIAAKAAEKREAERRKRMIEGAATDLKSAKAVKDSDASKGLFRVGKPTMDIQTAILQEAKLTNKQLDKIFGSFEEFQDRLEERGEIGSPGSTRGMRAGLELGVRPGAL